VQYLLTLTKAPSQKRVLQTTCTRYRRIKYTAERPRVVPCASDDPGRRARTRPLCTLVWKAALWAQQAAQYSAIAVKCSWTPLVECDDVHTLPDATSAFRVDA